MPDLLTGWETYPIRVNDQDHFGASNHLSEQYDRFSKDLFSDRVDLKIVDVDALGE